MAAATLTPSRFGSSFSGSRETFGADAPSMADSLPAVDFGFNDLRERMAQFTVRFDEFIERGRKRVLEERNAFRVNVAELAEVQRARRVAISEVESKSSDHAETLAKEAVEQEEMEEAIRLLNEQKEEHVQRRDQLKAEIATVQTDVRQRRDAQAVHQRAQEAQARHNVPELRFWEHYLGLHIEASALGTDDQLRFTFACLDERDEGKDGWFELNMGGSEYHVPESKPRLDQDHLARLVNQLNGSRQLGPFLKDMRSSLAEAIRL